MVSIAAAILTGALIGLCLPTQLAAAAGSVGENRSIASWRRYREIETDILMSILERRGYGVPGDGTSVEKTIYAADLLIAMDEAAAHEIVNEWQQSCLEMAAWIRR